MSRSGACYAALMRALTNQRGDCRFIPPAALLRLAVDRCAVLPCSRERIVCQPLLGFGTTVGLRPDGLACSGCGLRPTASPGQDPPHPCTSELNARSSRFAVVPVPAEAPQPQAHYARCFALRPLCCCEPATMAIHDFQILTGQLLSAHYARHHNAMRALKGATSLNPTEVRTR